MLEKTETEIEIVKKNSVTGTMVACFVFCGGDCPFESSADTYGEVTRCDAGCQEVSRCSIKDLISENVHYIHLQSLNKAEPTLSL